MKRPARMNPNQLGNFSDGGSITSSHQVANSVNKMITPRSVSARAQSRANFSMNKKTIINVNRNPSINPFTSQNPRSILTQNPRSIFNRSRNT